MNAFDPFPETLFNGPDERSRTAFLQAINTAASHVADSWERLTRTVACKSQEQLISSIAKLNICPDNGIGLGAALEEVSETILPNIAAVSDPNYLAHYHSPPMLPSLAAEVLISATNQSLDSFDQSPSATVLEMHVVRWLCSLVGFDLSSDGVFTGGATQSNLMGLLLARDAYGMTCQPACDISKTGLPEDATRWKIITSDLAHFSIAKSAHVLGLGNRSVVCIDSGSAGTISAKDVKRLIKSERERGCQPIALVLTAGTTDLGSIDQIEECTLEAQSEGIWVHLDAAAGGALLLSDQHRKLLRGIERVDSIAIDFHKWFFQAISCGIFAVRDGSKLNLMRRDIPYLDPSDSSDGARLNLVGKTIQTTRRFDALKVFLSMRAAGRMYFANLIDRSIRITQTVADFVDESRWLVLLARPMTNTVLFRWQPQGHENDLTIEDVNRALPHILRERGIGSIGRTVYHGSSALKTTLVNPLIEVEQVCDLFRAIERHGLACWQSISTLADGEMTYV